MKSSRGFTLIELLVVIAIIGILMALLFPAVSGALDAAKKAQAKNDVTQIATALIAYETEYGKFPPSVTSDSAVDVSGDLLATLMAVGNGTNAANNPRAIVFLEVPNWKKGKGGLDGAVGSGAFKDGWGNIYRVALDANYDNTLASVGQSPGPTATSLRKKVAVWSYSTNGKNDTEKKRRAVASWE